MSIALIQTAQSTSTGSNLNVSLGSPPAAGDIVVALCYGTSNTTNITSVTENTSTNTFLQVSGARATDAAVTGMTDIWYAANWAGSGQTFTFHFDSTFSGVILIAEFSGVKTTSPVDDGEHTNNGTTTMITPTLTTTVTGDLLIATNYNANDNSVGPGSWTSILGGSPMNQNSIYFVAGVASTYNNTWGSNPNFCASGAAFKPAATGASAKKKASMFQVF